MWFIFALVFDETGLKPVLIMLGLLGSHARFGWRVITLLIQLGLPRAWPVP